MNVAGVAAVGELRLEAPVEFVARITEHALGCDDDLVQSSLLDRSLKDGRSFVRWPLDRDCRLSLSRSDRRI